MQLRSITPIAFLAVLAVSSSDSLAQPAQPTLRERLAREQPPIDREQFRLSASAATRADLLACRNREATITQPRDINLEEFSRALHGVWVNRNARTVHGLLVATDTVFYIDMKGATGTAILVDRNNLGRPVLTEVFEPGGKFAPLAARSLKQPNFMGQVNCTYEFLDHYVKVSDQVVLPALIATTQASLPKSATPIAGKSLKDIWLKLVQSSYFEYLDMPTKTRLGPTTRVRRQLGDKNRNLILPEGGTVTEGDVEAGRAPGTEYHLPMLTGGYFEITLTSRKRKMGADGREFDGVHMRWDAEYRGVGIGSNPGEAVAGVEEGEFFGEGKSFVSARSISGDLAWTSNSCGDKNGLIDLGRAVNPDPTARTRTSNLTPEFVFERFVIGRP